MRRLFVIACAAALLAPATLATPAAWAAPPSKWIGTWGASPTPPPATAQAFDNQTIRQVVKISAGGKRVRVRLTNEYGTAPLVIGAATLAVTDGQARPLTFGGRTIVTIPRGAPMLSDPIDLPVAAQARVTIDLFLPGKTGPCTCHPTGAETATISGPGDFTGKPFGASSTITARAFISGVQVEPARATPVVITFGDSITDGFKSTDNTDRRWPDVLSARLGGRVSVVAQAISGNRVMNYALPNFGDAALARFDRDVLSVPGAKWMVVLEGINDLGMTRDPRPTAADMIAGYRQIIDRAHAHGLTVYGATLLPYEGAAYYSPEGEKVRQEVNAWLRSKASAFDGLIDFDAIMRDASAPTKLKADLQSGDWLHPNDAGYKLMGEAVDLRLFR